MQKHGLCGDKSQKIGQREQVYIFEYQQHNQHCGQELKDFALIELVADLFGDKGTGVSQGVVHIECIRQDAGESTKQAADTGEVVLRDGKDRGEAEHTDALS